MPAALRVFALLAVVAGAAGCVSSNAGEGTSASAFVVVDNQSRGTYDLYANRTYIARVGAQTKRRLPLDGTLTGAGKLVEFEARPRESSAEGSGIRWDGRSIETGQTVVLTIPYRR